MISRRVEYIRYCDVDGCMESEANSEWLTRQLAVLAAAKDGWLRLGRNRWMCPRCREKAEAERSAGRKVGDIVGTPFGPGVIRKLGNGDFSDVVEILPEEA